MPETITILNATIDLDSKLLLLFVVVYIAGIIRGFTGFGSALLTVPALAVLYGPVEAVIIEVLIEIPVSLGLLPVVLRKAERKTVLPMLLMFIVFVPIGALFLKVVEPDVMKVLISILVLFFVAIIAMQDKLAVLLSRSGIIAAGIFSGFSQGMTGMAGPLFATALLARGEDASLTRANIAALAGGVIAVSVISFFLVGLISLQAVVYAALSTPAILLGVWTGAILFNRFSHLNLRGIILAFLAVTAIVTLFQALA